ncbi:hypothetical protein, partial [Asticcacaulis sp. AC460]
VFGKIAYSERDVDNHQLTYTRGTVNINTLNVATPNYTGRTYTDTTAFPIQRTAIPGSGYYLYNGVSQGSVLANGNNEASRYVNGIVANINPASVTVDDSHH